MSRYSYNEVDINSNDLIVSQSLVIPTSSVPIANLTGGISFSSGLNTIQLQCNSDVKRLLHPDNVNIQVATITSLTGFNLDYTNISCSNLSSSTGTSNHFFSNKLKVAGTGTAQENLDVNGNILVKGGTSSIYWNSTNTSNNYMRIFNIDQGVYLGSYWDWNGGNLNFRNGINGINSMTLTTSGDMTLTSGLFLPTSGGTASRLDYYETISTNHAFGFTTNSGTNQTVSVKFTRIGNKITIQIPQFLVNCGNQSRSSIPNLVAIATRFRPTSRICQPVICFFGGTSGSQTFTTMLEVQTTGIIDIFRDNAKTQFQLTSCGPKDTIVISYTI